MIEKCTKLYGYDELGAIEGDCIVTVGAENGKWTGPACDFCRPKFGKKFVPKFGDCLTPTKGRRNFSIIICDKPDAEGRDWPEKVAAFKICLEKLEKEGKENISILLALRNYGYIGNFLPFFQVMAESPIKFNVLIPIPASKVS